MFETSPTEAPGQPHARLLRRLLALAWRYRGRCTLVLSVQLLLLALTVLGLGWTGVGLDIVHRALDADAPAPRWPWGWAPPWTLTPWESLLLVAGTIAVFALLRTVLSFVYGIAVGDLVHGQIVPTIRAQVYTKLQTLSFRFFDRHPGGSLLNRVTSDVQYLRSFVDGVLIQAAVMLLALLVYGVYMVSIHAGLSLACLASTPLLALMTVRFSRRSLPAHGHARAQSDALVVSISEALQGVQVIKGFAREPHFLAQIRARNTAVHDAQAAIFRQISMFVPTVDLITLGNVTVLLAYGGTLVARQQLTVGELVVFATLLQQFSLQVSTIATIMNTLQESLIGARRVFEVLDTETEVAEPAQPVPLPHVLGKLRFEHVQFGYDAAQPVLHDLSFEVAPGELVALFGAAGAGKSSLLALVPRFYDVQQGSVSVDDVDVRALGIASLRQSTAVVFQETFLFSNTVAANIAFGHPEATQAQIEHAARLAAAHDFITQLPHGYDSVLGEFATNLSGGQRQRIAIARALLGDPRILLLDDPTAALDADTTRQILGTLETAAHGRTTLIATHRPQLLKAADRILVLENGRLVQQGTHTTLMASDGPYRRALQTDVHALPTANERAS